METRLQELKTLYLVRHGETCHNVRGILQGTLDSPLTPRGRRQALEVAGALAALGARPSLAIASPQGRARATLDLVRGALPSLAQVPVRAEAFLAEMDYGAWQGAAIATLPFDPWKPGDAAARRGGETSAEVRWRVLTGALRVMDEAAGDVLAVSHGTVMAHLLEALRAEDAAGGQPRTTTHEQARTCSRESAKAHPLAVGNGCILVLAYDPRAGKLEPIESLPAGRAACR